MKGYSIFVILTKTNTLFARLIRSICNDNYSHASLSLDINKDLMYSFGRKNYYNIFIGGFVEETTNSSVFGKHKSIPCVILEIKVTKEEYESISKEIKKFLDNKPIYKYNYLGVLGNKFNKEYLNDKRFFCSEFVYYVISNNIDLENRLSRTFVRPETFLHMRECNMVFYGDLKEFINKRNIEKELKVK